METRYTVRQAAEMTGIKAYVMRYWEEELDLHIQRNELGHRYYTGSDIQLFMNIKELKKRGLQLRAIRDLIPQILYTVANTDKNNFQLLEGDTEEIPPQDSLNNITEKEGENVTDPKILEFQAILERLITQEIRSKNEDEERFRSLDLAIRKQQMARREIAAALSDKRSTRETRIHKNI